MVPSPASRRRSPAAPAATHRTARRVASLAATAVAALATASALPQDGTPAPRAVPGAAPGQDDPQGPPPVLVPGLTQDGPTEEQRALLAADQRIDFAVAVVGGQVITRSDVFGEAVGDAELKALLGQGREAETRAMTEALLRIAERQLEERAGRARGFDPEIVESLLDRDFQAQVDRLGGAESFSKALQEASLSPQAFRRMREGDMYRHAWEDSITGQSPGPLGRIITDRYVRPGELLSAYMALCDSQLASDRALVGIQPERLTLQRMILDVRDIAGRTDEAGFEETLKVARTLRDQVLRGEVDFDEQTRLWDVRKGNNSRMEDLTLPGLTALEERDHARGGLASWGLTAEVGDVSQPLRCTQQGVPPTVMMYAVVERKARTEPKPFVDLEVQQALRTHLEEQLDQRRLRLGRQRVVLESQIFPGDLRPALLSR